MSELGAAPNATESVQAALPVTIIEPSKRWLAWRLGELVAYRELLGFLAWRDIKVKYKQAVIGIAWTIVQPVTNMIIFTVIFGRLAKLPSEDVPYPLFSFAALLPWQLFSGSLQHAGTSVVANANLLSKIYFPRLVIPLASVITALVDFAIAFVVLLALMVWYGQPLTWAVLTLPAFLLLALLTSVGVGLWLSALNVLFRDVQYAIPFLIQAWMYASPVAYSGTLVPEGHWRIIYGLNPMAGVIQGFRWALLGTEPPGQLMYASVAMVLVIFVTGLAYFKRMERTFADVI